MGAGITTNGNDYGFTVIAKDNVIIEELYENHFSSAQPAQFSIFIYTEESIYIDAVNSRLNIEGALFARALGVSGNQIFYSYRGYINNSGVGVPSASNSANGFYIEKVASGNYQDRFYNIPVFESLVQIPGMYTFETSEWLLE